MYLIGTVKEQPMWLPIASAPMNGTWVLIYAKDKFLTVGIYKNNLNSDTHKAQPGWTDLSVDSFAWRTFSRLEPTHWMPLPEPPGD